MRYAQLARFKEIGDKGQKLLETKTVAIVGMGSIGSTVAVMLMRSGVNLRIIDKGRCEIEDLSCQSIYREDDHTKFKAKQAKKRLEEVNPKVRIKTFHEDLNKNNIYLAEADVVVDATGNLETSKLISENAKKKKMPLIMTLASGGQGIVVASEKGINIEKVKKIAAKMRPVEESGMINPTVHIAASLIVAEAFKMLLKKPYRKDAFVFDVWNDSYRKQKI